MDFNDMLKKMVDTSIGIATASAEKMADFAEQMSKKGQEAKENKMFDMNQFFASLKEKFEQHFTTLTEKLDKKGKRIDALEKEVESLKKQVDALTKKSKAS